MVNCFFIEYLGSKTTLLLLENENFSAASSFQFLDNLAGNKLHDLKILYDLFGFSPFGSTLNPNIISVDPGYLVVINCSGTINVAQKV